MICSATCIRFNISNANPANWKATKLFQATYTKGAVTTRQPITTQPYVFKHPTQPGFIIIIGTGSYITETDGVSTEIQSVYGIWDRGEVAPATANSNAKATRLVQSDGDERRQRNGHGVRKAADRVGEPGRSIRLMRASFRVPTAGTSTS